ncbi:MAG TPA: universal stress protein [Coleofasciculaceae cyanobacterium]
MIKKILFADSGTGQSEEMLKFLMEIPGVKDAHVTVLHVVPGRIGSDEMTEKLEAGGKMLARAIEFLGLPPEQVSPMLQQGDPKDLVCRVAEDLQADLIVMGSRGLKRLQSILENSVSQYVFQLSSRPMLLVKDDIYVKRINRVMVAIDKSEASKQALNLALFLTRDIKGGQLILTHVDAKRKADEVVSGEGDEVLAGAIAEAKKMGVGYKAISAGGKAGETICRLAEANNADLLLLGSPDRRPSVAKGLPDLDRLLGSSLSDYVRVYANCPVLLTRVPSA